MIIKGHSRAAPRKLAQHLLRTDTNEQVRVLECNGLAAKNLQAALVEMQALTAGTKGKKGLYHASISPDQEYSMTSEQWQQAVDVLEQNLKLDGQSRVVVLHEKMQRQHLHVVWSRVDQDKMKLRSDSHNYAAHERAARHLERTFEHRLTPGVHIEVDRSSPRPVAAINHAEWQQAERTKQDPRERKAAITKLWNSLDSGQAFVAALKDKGYVLAQGKRATVLVDRLGEIYSLNRQIQGVKVKQIKDRLRDIDLAALPSVGAVQKKAVHQMSFRQEHKTMANLGKEPREKLKELGLEEDYERIKDNQERDIETLTLDLKPPIGPNPQKAEQHFELETGTLLTNALTNDSEQQQSLHQSIRLHGETDAPQKDLSYVEKSTNLHGDSKISPRQTHENQAHQSQDMWAEFQQGREEHRQKIKAHGIDQQHQRKRQIEGPMLG